MQGKGSSRFKGPKQALGVQEPQFVLANKQDLSAPKDAAAQTYTQAKIAQRKLGAKKGDWQVVASYEVKS